MTLAGAIKLMFRTLLSREKIYCIIGTVNDVDNVNRVCTVLPIDGSPELFDVRMTSEISTSGGLTDGFCIFPLKGSIVTVAFINSTTGIIINSNTASQIFSDTALFQFNQGTYEGLIKIVSLTQKLNNLKTETENNLLAIQTAITALGGAYTPLSLTQFNKSDYEDTKVKH